MSYICNYCDNSYINKCHLTRHQKTESCIKIQNIIFKKDELYKNKYNTKDSIKQLEKLKNLVDDYTFMYISLNFYYDINKNIFIKLKNFQHLQIMILVCFII